MADGVFDRGEFVAYFRDEATELLDRIDSDLLGLETGMSSGDYDHDVVNALFRSLHTIKGSAGMLDFTVVQRVAHRLENAIDLLRSGKIGLDEELLELTFNGRDLLSNLIGRAVNGDTDSIPEVDTYITAIEAFVENAGVDQNLKADPTSGSGGEAGFDNDDAISAFEAEIERLLAAQRDADELTLLADAASTGDGAETSPAGDPGDAIAASFATPPAATAEADVTTGVTVAGAPPTAVVEVAATVADAPPAAPSAAVPPVAAAAAESAGAAPAAAKPTAAAPPAVKVPGPASTIRVDLERLDLLLDLVGELVINRTRITAIAASLQTALERDPVAAAPLAKELATSSATLARITNELQESVMKARMVPVGQVFERFPRTVRDLAKTTGKQITLSMSGVDTDLDKTIVDQIGEPLMHLVRNCADHGVEKPEVREAAGKSRHGTIYLNAYHEGNQVIIEVGDDGGGISVDRVRARGIERGLIDASAHYSDAEIVDLIFAPGFSTAEVVTGISGRGVGMDVVRKSVLDLKGQLDVDTKLGRGSTFTIRLPLTLAIIRTLLVGVADRLFAIPLDVVIESQRISKSDVKTISGACVVTLRGQVVPLVMIREVFGLAPSDPNEEYAMIVIVSHKGRRVGIVVDSFDGDQEIVIKPLSEMMGNTQAIAGATILGNGLVALILDIAQLAVGLPRNDFVASEHHPEPMQLDQRSKLPEAVLVG